VQETILGKQEPSIEETPLSTDSLVNVVEQIKTIDNKPREQRTIVQPSSLTTDETSSTALQSNEIKSQDAENEREQYPSTINSLTEIVHQINFQPRRSSVKEQEIPTHPPITTLASRQEDRLSSVDSAVESTQSVITTDQQTSQDEGKQQAISSIPSTVTETVERTISTDRQPSVELPSIKDADKQVSSDSLVEIAHQIRTVPQATRLTSTDNETDTTHIVEQQIEKPSIDASVETIQTDENIPNESVSTADIKEDVIPASTSVSFVTDTKQETTSEDATKANEMERLSTEALTETVHEILATSPTVPLPSDNLRSETIESAEENKDKSVSKDISTIQKENVHGDVR
jgi:hypothetical protein